MANHMDPHWAWEPYRPSDKNPWDIKKVGHVYRRAAFGATWSELDTGLHAGPKKLLDGLLQGQPGLDKFERLMEPLAKSITNINSGRQAAAYWLYRMLYSPHPVQEKVTLFWHNHFATSDGKVRNAGFMLGQYALMRRHALGSFRALLTDMAKDPAMMVWLDTRLSKKAMPNENYARELMELFSLGIGHYTEKDIREAARAFTGWEIRGTETVYNPKEHDDGTKTVFGQTGTWQADDIARICLEQPSAPRFIVGKLYRFFISETVPATPELLEPLAVHFRQSNFDTGALISTMLRSNLFFAPEVYRSRVKSPVDFAVGIVHGLEGKIGSSALAQALENLGQSLFYPPTVKGWDGGPTWLNGQTLLFRQNLALALTSTEDARFGRRTDPAALAHKYGKTTDRETFDFFLRLFLQDDVTPSSRAALERYVQQSAQSSVPAYWTKEDAANHRVRSLCHLVLTLPEFQLS